MKCMASNCYLSLWRSAAAAAKSLQLCPTLCDPIDSSPSGSLTLGWNLSLVSPAMASRLFTTSAT